MVLVVSLLGSAGGQKSGGSRLHGMVMGWMDGMSSMTSRIGTGILRSLGVDRRTIVRQLPAGEQLNIARPSQTSRGQHPGTKCPPPWHRATRKERQQPRRNNRLTFRQFVDSAMSGISKMLPSFAVGHSTRNYHVRGPASGSPGLHHSFHTGSPRLHHSLRSPSHDQQMTTTTTTTKSPFHVNDWPHIDSSLEFPDLDHFFTSEFEGYPGWQGEGDVVPASEDSNHHDPNYYNPGDNLESITSDLNDEGTSGYLEFDSQDELGDGRNLQYKNGFVQGYQKGYDDGERVNSHVQGSNGTSGYAMPGGNGGPDNNGGWSYGSSGNRDPSNDGWMSSSGSGGQQGSHPVNSYSVNNNPSTVGERGEEELVQVTDVEPTAATATVGGMVLAGVHGSRLHNSPQQQQPQPATTTRFSPAHKRDRGHQTYRHTKPQPPATTTTRFSPVHERDRGHQTHPYTKPQPEIQHNRKHYLNPYDRYRQRPSSTTRGRGDTGRPSYSSSWGTHHQPGPPYSTFPVRLHNI
ncbi:hypothetical protein Pcinc_026239, partial [Petrolisthes cinctipes]